MADILQTQNRANSSRLVTCCITNVTTKTSVSLTAIARKIRIYNSLESMVTSGFVEVVDQGNAIQEYKLNGKEILDIEIHLNDNGSTGLSNSDSNWNVYKRRFLVYAIESIGVVIDQMSYKILFIDPFALVNTDTRISWHFKKTKAEDIIKKIGSSANGELNSPYKNAVSQGYRSGMSIQNLFNFKSDASTLHELDIYVPMMKPFELIRYVADRALSTDGSETKWSDCLFYQSKDGTFHFDSFKNLFKKKPLVFGQQISQGMMQEKMHLIETYTFNKIYNIQEDKLNGIYGLQFAIADFKPTARKVSQTTVLGTNIVSKDDGNALKSSAKSKKSISLKRSVFDYFSGVDLGLSFGNDSSSRQKCGFIEPFQCSSIDLSSTQKAGLNGQTQSVSYNTQTGSLIFLDACGIIHEDDLTYNEYERVTLPYVTGCIMKKVLSTYVVNLSMTGAFDVDVCKPFVINLEDDKSKNTTRQMSTFVNGVHWLCSDVSHEWRSDTMQVKTYVTGFTPFLKKGTRFTVKS